jgi:hypothetical protein
MLGSVFGLAQEFYLASERDRLNNLFLPPSTFPPVPFGMLLAAE